MSDFLQKLGFGLKKSSSKIGEGFSAIFNKRTLDSQTLAELEDLLIESDMGVRTASEIVARMALKKVDKNLSAEEIKKLLAAELTEILRPCEAAWHTDFDAKPYVILMVGVNGAGKTTTIGKLAARLQKEGKQVSFIAGDTFRAAAVEQLKIWGDRAGIRVFSGKDGCDSAGLCFDGLNAAIKAGDDVVFIDTAGRLQNKNGLMDELGKMIRVIQKVLPDAPHKTLLTLDATTGQNAVSQVEIFKKVCRVDGLVMTKLDGSSKGGVLVAVAGENPTPVYFIGVGEKTDDLDVFDAAAYAESLLGL
jgi:fused signal recognition particle receptor